jgi:4,5-dihydroxyphthalate decarboxylase
MKMLNTREKAPLTLALTKKLRSMALIDGTVKPEGIDLTCTHEFRSVRERHDAVAAGKYDSGEMSTANCIPIKETGGNLILLPVFYLRGFRQGNIFCNVNSGVQKFADLKGKTVGVTAFGATTIVWVRGMLHHYYGVPRESIRWIVGEKDTYDVQEYTVKVERIEGNRQTVWDMVVKGEIDAAIFPGNNDHWSIYPGDDLYRRIDSYPSLKLIQAEEKDLVEYYQATGIYPIIHSIAIQRDLVSKNPEIARNLLAAFRQARQMATNYMSEEEKRMAEGEMRLLGRDPYDYTLNDEDRETLDALMQYLVEDGILKEKPAVETLFADGTI